MLEIRLPFRLISYWKRLNLAANGLLKYPAGVRPSANIYLRLFLPFSASLLAATVLAWWVATSLLSASLEERLDEQLEHTASVLAEGDFPLTVELLARLKTLLRAEFVLIREDGTLGPATIPTTRGPIYRELLHRIQRWQAGGTRHFEIDYAATPHRLVIHPLEDGRNRRFTAIAALASLADVRAASRRAAWWLGGAVLLGTFVLAWVGHRISRSVTDPVRQLAHMAERIAVGDRKVRVQVSQGNEIGMLAGSLNTMAAHLEDFEKEVAEQSRLAALGKMAARVAHEVRNPLTAIKLQVQLLEESLDPERRALTTTLLSEVRRLELIVSGTLAVGRPQRIQPRETDLNSLVTEVTELMGPQLSHRNIRLETRIQKLPPALLDSDAVKQILLNLLTNAADELVQGGAVRVTTRHDQKEWLAVLMVEDSGDGILPERRGHLFTPLTSGKEDGLGIGLALSRELVEAHQGSIAATDSPELGGACFTVRFPLAGGSGSP